MCFASDNDHRLTADIICCPGCGSTAVFRRGSKAAHGYWRCRGCGQQWREDLQVGRGKLCNAKLPEPDAAMLGDWLPGQRRREARLLCCPHCRSSKVRCSSRRTFLAYWYCGICSQGWVEPAGICQDDAQACRVKVPLPTGAVPAAAASAV